MAPDAAPAADDGPIVAVPGRNGRSRYRGGRHNRRGLRLAVVGFLVAVMASGMGYLLYRYPPWNADAESASDTAGKSAKTDTTDRAGPPKEFVREITQIDPSTVTAKGALAIFQMSQAEAKALAVAEASRHIDELVLTRLDQAKIPLSPPCTDAVFLRRAYIDLIGTLPTADEARAFLKDKNPDKRKVLIDQLLERPEYADYWAMKWCDLLRVKSEFPINLWPMAVQGYHRWIKTSIRDNKPYDQFARELLTASGSNFLNPPVNFYRAVQRKEPEPLAQAVALNFMGVRAQTWPKERWEGMAPFFAKLRYKATQQWKEEIVVFDPTKPPPKGISATHAVLPDVTEMDLPADRDPRQMFADWLIQPKNPWFTRNIANRAWSWLVGRGIIHEPDDIRDDNPPSNPELLAYLQEQLVASRYDMKQLFRMIMNSRTYQASSIAGGTSPEAAALFASYPLRRLDAEVLIDAICQITGTTEKYYSPIPEPFTFIPEHVRSVSLPDASITSAFLELFGRPPRDTGLESERNNRPTPSQQLHMVNSTHIQNKLDHGPKLQALMNKNGPADEVMEELYLTILSRFPSDDEVGFARGSGLVTDSSGRPRPNLAWVLINSPEFLYRH